MNKYLLLRDNKQSGPYSVEELQTKGLKPYDLVWLDGKSAAWRYPSEMAELKSFAPAVEEQPYDRFYKKKPAQQETAWQQADTAVVQQEAVVVQQEVAQTETPKQITTKKIYVTLPAARNRVVTVSNEATKKDQAGDKAMAEKKAADDAAILSEQFARLREEKIKQAESMASNPVVTSKAVTPKTVTPPATSVNDNYQTPAFSAIVEKNHPVQEEKLAPVIKQKSNSNKILLRSMVAACLLLGGVIIGLVISNSRQQQNSAAIEKLVQQIQEREKRNQAVTTPVEQQEQNNIPEHDNTVIPQGPATALVNDQQNSIGTPVNNKQLPPTVSQKKETPPVNNDQQQQDVKIIPAVITNKPEEKPVNRQEAESARKNIHQLVAVDANKYKIGVLGGISDLRLTISNNSLYPLDQVEVEVRYFGPEKRVVKTQMLLFNDVAAGEQKTLEAPRTTRGVTVDYTITRINSKALGLVAHVGY